MPAKVDRGALFGKRFGRWTVLGEIRAQRWKSDRHRWVPQWRLACRCECGTLGSVPGDELLRGHSTSCGCYSAEAIEKRRTKHGHTKGRKWSAEFVSWQRMKARCLDKDCTDYPEYGGAGITIYEKWISDFAAFLEHVGPRPAKGMTIDRINGRLGYLPGNVRWATSRQQARNRKSNRLVEFEGRLITVAEAAEKTGLKPSNISMRIARGWKSSDLLKPLHFRP